MNSGSPKSISMKVRFTIFLLLFCSSCLGVDIQDQLIQRRNLGSAFLVTSFFIKSGLVTITTYTSNGKFVSVEFRPRKQEVANILEEALLKKYDKIPDAYTLNIKDGRPVLALNCENGMKLVTTFRLSDDHSRFEEENE